MTVDKFIECLKNYRHLIDVIVLVCEYECGTVQCTAIFVYLGARSFFLSLYHAFNVKHSIKHQTNTRVHKYNGSQVNKSVAPQQTHTYASKYKQTHFQWFVLYFFSYCCCACMCSVSYVRTLVRCRFQQKIFVFRTEADARIQRNSLIRYVSAQHTKQ